MIGEYRKLPVEVLVEALVWTGENLEEVHEFVRGKKWFVRGKGGMRRLIVPQNEMSPRAIWDCPVGYVLVKSYGVVCQCAPDIFAQTYESV